MVQVAGISDICLETSIGTKLVLKDVKHVPDIMMNLISTEKLDDEGYFSYTVVVNGSSLAVFLLWLKVKSLRLSIGCRLRSPKMLLMRWRMIVPWSYDIRDSVT